MLDGRQNFRVMNLDIKLRRQISQLNVEGTAWFLLAAHSEIREEREKQRIELLSTYT